MPVKILIIRFSAFGDVVQTLSVPPALKSAFPGAEIHWVTRKDASALVQGHPDIHRVWDYDRKKGIMGLARMGIEMRKAGFTHIYDAHNNLRSHFLTWILRPLGFLNLGPKFIRRSIRRWKRFLLFKLRINKFEMPFSGQRDLLEPLAAWGVAKSPPPAPQIFPNEINKNKAKELLGTFQDAIALAPSSAHFLKRWPKEYWKQLILQFPDQKFVLLGGPQDSFLEEIRAVAPERVLNLSGHSPLSVSTCVVQLSKVLVTNDTWLLHAAEQLGKNAIALMGPAPFGFPCRQTTTIMELKLPCRPCSKHGQGPCTNKARHHQCLVDITPEAVSIELRVQLSKRL
jgi:ADP-heptose:LPS heptosyltransferase